MGWWIVGALAGLAVFYGLVVGAMSGENLAMRRGSAYQGALDRALAAEAIAKPGAAFVTLGFRTNEIEPKPCHLPPRDFANGLGMNGVACTAVTVQADATPPWFGLLVPQRIMITTSRSVWADGDARRAIMRLARDQVAICAEASRRENAMARADRHVLGCDTDKRPRYSVWLRVTDNPFSPRQAIDEPGATRLS